MVARSSFCTLFCRRQLQSYRSVSKTYLGRHCADVFGNIHCGTKTNKQCASHQRRLFSSVPFYGAPAPPSTRYTQNVSTSSIPPLTPLQRVTTLIHSSITALNDPTRADAVAAVGEVTGSFALANMRNQMQNDPTGRRILQERPVVDERVAKRAFDLLKLHNESNNATTKSITFGAAYATFLQTHNFDPEERSPIRFISDPDLGYVMTRYRQCHDYFHVLTGLPPTVLGELALKWLELMQTGLPLAALSATGGSLRLSAEEREILWNVYFPWAVRVGRQMKDGGLMCVYYEEEMETDLDALRGRIAVEPAPIVGQR